MRVIVCGGRQFADAALLTAKLDELHERYRFTVLIEGDAEGADRLAGAWADAHGIEHLKYPPNRERLGAKAPKRRNRQMLEEGKPDLVVAFPGSTGTAHMVNIARLAGVTVIEIEGNPI